MPEDKVEVRINQAINFVESHELCPTTFKPLQLKQNDPTMTRPASPVAVEDEVEQ